MPRVSDELPETVRPSQFRNGLPQSPWDQGPTTALPNAGSKPGTRNGVPVPSEVGGTARAEVPRSELVNQGQEGPLGMGRVSALERGEPRQTASGLKPIATGQSDGGAKISHAELAAYSNRPDRNYGGAGRAEHRMTNPLGPKLIPTTPPSGPKENQGVKTWGGE